MYIMYESTLRTKVHYVQKYITYKSTLRTKVHYVQKYIMYKSTLCTKVHYVRKYIMYESTLCTKVHYVRKYIMYESTLCTNILYVLTYIKVLYVLKYFSTKTSVLKYFKSTDDQGITVEFWRRSSKLILGRDIFRRFFQNSFQCRQSSCFRYCPKCP